ncbi:unnamed protein product [Rotaria sordida]|uniref:Uncharacterized protein n=1 Tax=Rotaria sordida TaxID=392033 RepID=A0A814Z2N4_9BILA|nr:unnamed protein product [Rotaria sordida]CAF1265171.1 unnamed protein product [Rotaria sordida]
MIRRLICYFIFVLLNVTTTTQQFDNVYIATPRLKVSWGTMSILEAERLCQTYLLKQSSKWHYHMTIAGTELPIQTNLNRIQILQLAPDKSRNDVSSFPQSYNRQKSKKSPPPSNLTVYKGEFHSILTRDLIQVVHTNPLALEFWSFLNGTDVPDEQFYPTLVHLPELPGGKARGTSTYVYSELLSHYKIWRDGICQSKQFRSGVCQFNYKDLMNIEQSGRLFANKFNQNLDLVGIDCWKQWLRVKQVHHQDIAPQNYVDKFPFTRRIAHMHYSENTTIKSKLNRSILFH